jgi:hypothetical protein
MSSNVSDMKQQIQDVTRDLYELNNELGNTYRLIGSLNMLTHRMGMPENVKEAMNMMYSVMHVVNSLRAAYLALQAARMAAGDPIAWAQFGAAALATGVGIYAEVERRSEAW